MSTVLAQGAVEWFPGAGDARETCPAQSVVTFELPSHSWASARSRDRAEARRIISEDPIWGAGSAALDRAPRRSGSAESERAPDGEAARWHIVMVIIAIVSGGSVGVAGLSLANLALSLPLQVEVVLFVLGLAGVATIAILARRQKMRRDERDLVLGLNQMSFAVRGTRFTNPDVMPEGYPFLPAGDGRVDYWELVIAIGPVHPSFTSVTVTANIESPGAPDSIRFVRLGPSPEYSDAAWTVGGRISAKVAPFGLEYDVKRENRGRIALSRVSGLLQCGASWQYLTPKNCEMPAELVFFGIVECSTGFGWACDFAMRAAFSSIPIVVGLSREAEHMWFREPDALTSDVEPMH